MAAKEVEERAAKDFDVCDVLLSQAPFLTGASPTAADCFLFALLDLVSSLKCVLQSTLSPASL